MDYETYNDALLHEKPLKDMDIPEGVLFLDIGCGDGRLVNELCRKGVAAVGIDYAPWTAARNIIRADAHHLPFKNNTFHYVYSSLVLGHIKDEEKAMSEIHRVSMDGCKILIIHVSKSPLNIKVNVWKGLGRPLQHYGIYRQYSPDKAKKVLETNGFTVSRIYTTNFAPPMLNFLPRRIRDGVYRFLFNADIWLSRAFPSGGKFLVAIAVKGA